MSDGRHRLIDELDAARDEMWAVVHSIDRSQEIYAGWTIQHVLAHIAGWDDAVIAALRAHAGGHEPGTPAAEGIDVYNAQSVATREALNYDQVVSEWQLAREEIKSILRDLPPEKFQEPLLYPWGPRGKVEGLIAIFCAHEKEHAAEIRELIQAPPA